MTPPEYSAITRGLQPEKRNRTPTVRQFLDEFSAPVRRSGWKYPALALAMLAAVSVAAWFYLHRPESTQPLSEVTDASRSAPATPSMPAPTTAPPSTTPSTSPATTAPASTASTPATTTSPLPAVAAAAAKPGSVIRDCPTCPQMTVLPTGSFLQGSEAVSGSSAYEKPQHRVAIAYSIAMANRDVTVGDFREFIAATGRGMQGCETYDGEWRRSAGASWKEPGFAQSDLHPVTCVSWEDAVAYAKWLSSRTGHRYRLPSASEWEYAARAGSTAIRPWGSDSTLACANANVADQSAARRYPGWDVFACDDGYVATAPVSTYKANAFGLDDMLGNVFQWTEDCWHGDYVGAPGDGAARQDGDCGERELRGGSWFSSPAYVRPAYRNHFATNYRTSSVGFRLVRENTP